MLFQQEGRCKLCGDPMMRKQEPYIDHAHTKDNRVRGLLCIPCNTGLGWFENVGLQKVMNYVAKENTK